MRARKARKQKKPQAKRQTNNQRTEDETNSFQSVKTLAAVMMKNLFKKEFDPITLDEKCIQNTTTRTKLRVECQK